MSKRKAFSLTEILIVVGVIALLLAVAMPAFNFITGGRSIDAATNQLSAFLARARTEAVGLQEVRGIFFYIDPATQREMMTLVQQTPALGTDATNVDVYLDTEDNDHIALPKGVGIECIFDGSTGSFTERYIGFNTDLNPNHMDSTMKIGEVILFDGFGRLANLRYGFRMMTNVSGTPTPTSMAMLIAPHATAPVDFTQIPANPPYSSPGCLLFDNETMLGKYGDGYLGDTAFGGPADASDEEGTLDDIATPILINRYNGTLVKGE